VSSRFIGANILNDNLFDISDLSAQVSINTSNIDTLNEQLQTLQGQILIPNDSSILVGNSPQPMTVILLYIWIV